MHELDYSSRSLMQLCKTRHPFCSIPRGYLIASALLLRAAYDSRRNMLGPARSTCRGFPEEMRSHSRHPPRTKHKIVMVSAVSQSGRSGVSCD